MPTTEERISSLEHQYENSKKGSDLDLVDANKAFSIPFFHLLYNSTLDKVVRVNGKSLDDYLSRLVQGSKGVLKITDSAPTEVGKYELVDFGEYENLVPIIPFGSDTPTTDPITTEDGYYNAVFWNGTNFIQIKSELPTIPVDDYLDQNSENAIQNKEVARKLAEMSLKIDNAFQIDEDGNFIILDGLGNVGFKISAEGMLQFASMMAGISTGGEIFIHDGEDNVALKIDKIGKTHLDLADSVIEKIRGNKEFDLDTPDYVFGTNSATGEFREYFTEIYPEGLTNQNLPIEIDGNKKLIIQSLNRTTESSESTPINITVGGNGYKYKDITVDYIRASRLNAQNEKIFLLGIGDSITDQNTNFFDGTGGSWINFIKQFAAMDNVDVSNINVQAIGTTNNYTRTINYGGSISVNTKSEGRSGWATYNYLNYPKWARIDGTAFETAHNFIGGEAMYYLAGLATRTPFDSSTAGQVFTAYDSSYNEVIAGTPVGRFKPDITESLWTALKSKWGLTSAFTTYTGNQTAIGNEINLFLFGAGGIANCNGGVCFDPDNPFFSITKGQAYTGSHVWTNKNAFSKTIYLSRYRTMDDNGNRLSAGNPALGSKVTDPNDYDVCTPTHVISGLGTNDFILTPEFSTSLSEQIWQEFSSIAQVGVFLPRRPGVYFPNKWQDYGLQREKNTADFPHIQNNLFKTTIGDLESSNTTYIPSFFTQSPISAAFSDRYAYDLDELNGAKKPVSGNDDVHLSAYALRSIAYQCLSWIYWTLRN